MASKRFPARRTSRGFYIYPVHYTEIEELDPARGGMEWYRHKRAGITSDRIWRREYEIDFKAAEGGLVYPYWDVKIDMLMSPVAIGKDWMFIRCIDPGVLVTGCLWKAMRPDGMIFNIHEYYAGSGVKGTQVLSMTDHARTIKRITQIIVDCLFGDGTDGEDIFDVTLIDPSADRKEGDLSTNFQRCIDGGLEGLTKAARDLLGGIERVKEVEARRKGIIHPNGIIGVAFPVKYSFPHLNYYRFEKERYHYQKESEKKSETRLDVPVKRNDHLMDCDRYGDVHLREHYVQPVERKMVNAFEVIQPGYNSVTVADDEIVDLRGIQDDVKNCRMIRCTFKQYPEVRRILQDYASDMIDCGDGVRAQIALEEVKRLDAYFDKPESSKELVKTPQDDLYDEAMKPEIKTGDMSCLFN